MLEFHFPRTLKRRKDATTHPKSQKRFQKLSIHPHFPLIQASLYIYTSGKKLKRKKEIGSEEFDSINNRKGAFFKKKKTWKHKKNVEHV